MDKHQFRTQVTRALWAAPSLFLGIFLAGYGDTTSNVALLIIGLLLFVVSGAWITLCAWKGFVSQLLD